MRNILIVSGPSGSGKTTLIARLLAAFPDLQFSVSHTTRLPRPGEVDGRDYHFVSGERFARMARQDRFAEWARVHGQRYGTSWAEIRAKTRSGRCLVLDVDTQGARTIKERFPEALGVFIVPPSLAALEQRLRARQARIDREARRRLEAARRELRAIRRYDYLVVNDRLEEALAELKAIVVAWRLQTSRRLPALRPLLRGRP